MIFKHSALWRVSFWAKIPIIHFLHWQDVNGDSYCPENGISVHLAPSKKVEHLINFQVHIWSHSSSCNIWANLKLETLVGVGEAGTPTRQLSVLDFLSSVRYAMPLPGPNSKCAQFKANGHETLNF